MMTVRIPGALEVLDGQLWHTITIPHGTYTGVKEFFTGNKDDEAHGLTNVTFGGLPYPKMFRIKRISLMPSLNSLSSDIDNLISNSTFHFGLAIKDYYSGPAQTFVRSRGLDSVMATINKLPKKAQLELLQNLKMPNGVELEHYFELIPQQVFRGRLITQTSITLKKDLKITCVLDGKMLRELHY